MHNLVHFHPFSVTGVKGPICLSWCKSYVCVCARMRPRAPFKKNSLDARVGRPPGSQPVASSGGASCPAAAHAARGQLATRRPPIGGPAPRWGSVYRKPGWWSQGVGSSREGVKGATPSERGLAPVPPSQEPSAPLRPPTGRSLYHSCRRSGPRGRPA